MAEIVGPSDFYVDTNQIIQTAIVDCHKEVGSADTLLVADRLSAMGKLDDVGGPVRLLEILESVPHSAHAAHYAGIVLERSRRRKAIAIGQKMIDQAYDLTADHKSLCEGAHDAARSIAETLNHSRTRPRRLADHVAGVIETYRSGQTPTVWWGVPEIDEMIGGVMPGELVVIGARPSMGKTLVGLQWLDESSRRGIPGLIISEEMSAASLATRSLSGITDIPSDRWRDDPDRLERETREYFAHRAPVLIAEKCATAAGAERAIARAVQSDGVRIVAVDYVQLLAGQGDSKEQRVADVSARMKAAAMRHDIVVLMLAQLNRQIETRQNAVPQLSDLRDSGGIEQDADVALFPFWPYKLDDQYRDPREYRIYCRKNRNRGIGQHVIQMRIDPERQRITGIEKEGTEVW